MKSVDDAPTMRKHKLEWKKTHQTQINILACYSVLNWWEQMYPDSKAICIFKLTGKESKQNYVSHSGSMGSMFFLFEHIMNSAHLP